jgi:hypothetical protein
MLPRLFIVGGLALLPACSSTPAADAPATIASVAVVPAPEPAAADSKAGAVPASPAPSAAAGSLASTADADYKADFEAFCNSGTRAPGVSGGSDTDRARKKAEWVSAQLKSDRFKKLFHDIFAGSMSPAERSTKLREETKALGIATCRELDEIDAHKLN